jgi:uncharacterized protein (DUF2235 family)
VRGRPLGKNIIVCSDGTGNTFGKNVSNVTRLVKLLAHHKEQVVVYDQGIGTSARRLKAVEDYRKSVSGQDALQILEGPRQWWFKPAGWPTIVLGLLGGWGLKANVRQMYCRLSTLYEGPDDKVFLFGFSRGAFTVRALAGLIYRCGLPGKTATDMEERFDKAWKLYKPPHKRQDDVAIRAFMSNGQRECPIHFLGLWDTVKSYGGLIPVMLPHLRHNPTVHIVRHALALDERRSWFDATTWGLLDLDSTKERIKPEDFDRQDIAEVWFRGCHSDIGGGDVEAVTGMIALRWMLGEAQAVDAELNDNGKSVLAADDPLEPEVHESLKGVWWVTENIPRGEINNFEEFPKRTCVYESTGRRTPDKLTRNGKVLIHPSVGSRHSILARVEYRPTNRGA